MKSLSKILDDYTNITKDTKKFIEKHKIQKVEDANGNDDKLFNASNINTHDRSKGHGYNPDQDKVVYHANMKSVFATQESVSIAEKLSPSQGIRSYIHDFQKSDAPQFEGKSKEERRKMAIAAYLQASGKSKNEDIDYSEKTDDELEALFESTDMEDEELVEAYTIVLQAIYESLDDEGQKAMEKMLDNDNDVDQLMQLAEEILQGGNPNE